MASDSTELDGIRVFFEPKSVALFGVSRTADKWGSRILSNLLQLEYEGKIFVVNPNISEINGVKAYPSLEEIPEAVELVVVAVPAEAVTQVMRDCEKKRVKGVVIITSGFNEAGDEGIKRQQAVVETAARVGIRVIGPNTTGTLNLYGKFTTSSSDLSGIRPGSVAFIAQTGVFAGLMLDNIASYQNFGLSKIAGLGNKCDVADHEILDYLAQDKETKVIIMYIEGIKNGKRFLDSARSLARNKPIIALKGGRTEQGARAAFSHTASLAGEDYVINALFSQAGIIRANDLDELMDYAKTFAFQPLPQGNRLAIITPTGGCGVVATDTCIESGLTLADLQPQTLEKIQAQLPYWAIARHPIDIAPLSQSIDSLEAYRLSVSAALTDPGVDSVLLIAAATRAPATMFPESVINFLSSTRNISQKPFTICLLGHKEIYDRLYYIFERAGIPVFPGIRRAVSSLAALSKYKQFISST